MADPTIATFRTQFPEFNDAVYPDPDVRLWLDVALVMVNSAKWTNMYALGVHLFTAHHVFIEKQAARDVAIGATPGGVKGPVNSKSVDKVSLGYDTQSVIEQEAGHWNSSHYGTRFIRLARMFGSGGALV